MQNGDLQGELTRRQHGLLLAAVQEFIATAEPVGSQQLANRPQVGVRAAMVRNLMAELEDAGYLLQPHTSAGRIPTDKAFRYYVDHLTPQRGIGFEDRSQIELHYSTPTGDVHEIIRDTSRLLTLMTGQAALVTAPRLESVVLERVQFVRLREREVLAVFVAVAGGMQNRFVQTDADHSQAELDRMAGYLNESLRGRTLEQARVWIEDRLKEDRANYDRFMHAALILGGTIARGACNHGALRERQQQGARSAGIRQSQSLARTAARARGPFRSAGLAGTQPEPYRTDDFDRIGKLRRAARRLSAWLQPPMSAARCRWEVSPSSVRCGWTTIG